MASFEAESRLLTSTLSLLQSTVLYFKQSRPVPIDMHPHQPSKMSG